MNFIPSAPDCGTHASEGTHCKRNWSHMRACRLYRPKYEQVALRCVGGCQQDTPAQLANLPALPSGCNPNSFLFIESRWQRQIAPLEPYTLGPSGVLLLPLESRGLQVRDKRSDSSATIR